MRIRTLLAGLSAMALLALPATPAQAAVPRTAVKCGMVVMQDANLYLPKDLYCRDFGVSVLFNNAEGGPTPHVIVDLNGHTLYGSGRGRGVTAFAYPGPAYLQVLNGRVENFEIGVGGDNDTRISNVKLVGNHTGFFCNGGCWTDQSYFKNNSVVGMGVGAEAYASVKHSTFSGNKEGAFVSGINSLDIQRSTFYNNQVAVHATEARVAVSYSTFGKNGTGVLVTNETGEGCADLHKNKFSGNGKNVVGPTC